jgi:hypothetical protein
MLYVAGRINEAVESLGEMRRNLGENVRTRKDNAGWITSEHGHSFRYRSHTIHLNLAFTQQCLKSLESLGDSALASQNYTEAIIHYSATLSMGPVTRDGILVKRSNAHAAVGAWNDALNDADEVCPLLYLLHRHVFTNVSHGGHHIEPSLTSGT